VSNRSYIPKLYKHLLFEAERSGLLEEKLRREFRKVDWYHTEIAELIFSHGYCRVKGVPWGKSDIRKWLSTARKRRPNLIADYSELGSKLGISQLKLRRICPKIIHACLEALEEAQRRIMASPGGTESLDQHEDAPYAWRAKHFTEQVEECGFLNVFLAWFIFYNYISPRKDE